MNMIKVYVLKTQNYVDSEKLKLMFCFSIFNAMKLCYSFLMYHETIFSRGVLFLILHMPWLGDLDVLV